MVQVKLLLYYVDDPIKGTSAGTSDAHVYLKFSKWFFKGIWTDRGDRVLIPVPSVISRDSFSLWTLLAYRLRVAHHTLMDVPIYFRYFIAIYFMCLYTVLWPLHIGWLLGLSLYKEEYLQIVQCLSFWLHGFFSYWEGWVPVNRLNHTSWMTVVTSTHRPKSVCNRCVIEGFGSVFVLSIGFRIFCW